MKPAVYTIEGKGRARAIITNCGVSEAFNPSQTEKHPTALTFKGLWDTGATGTVITENVVRALNLKPVGRTKVHHANGTSEVDEYMINLMIENGVGFSVIKVTKGILGDFDVLIGMDIISHGDFAISNFENNTMFSFRIPSTEQLDLAEEKPKGKFGPTVPCPCGQGKMFKNCHGKGFYKKSKR